MLRTNLLHPLALVVLLPLTLTSSFQIIPPASSIVWKTRRTPNRGSSLFFNVDDIESQAVAAAEAWSVEVTAFLDEKEASLVADRLEGRADIACIRVGGRSGSVRSRFVLTNPDLGIDSASAEAEHCVVLCAENVDLGRCDPWPNMLVSIGVDLSKVGDVVVMNGSTTYLVVDPEIQKTCSRLLPKQLVGTGITVTALMPGESVPDGGDLQDMELQRLDKRSQKKR